MRSGVLLPTILYRIRYGETGSDHYLGSDVTNSTRHLRLGDDVATRSLTRESRVETGVETFGPRGQFDARSQPLRRFAIASNPAYQTRVRGELEDVDGDFRDAS